MLIEMFCHIRALLTIAGWVLFAVLLYVVLNASTESVLYDPFAILGISSVRALLNAEVRRSLTVVITERHGEGNQEALQKAGAEIVRDHVGRYHQLCSSYSSAIQTRFN